MDEVDMVNLDASTWPVPSSSQLKRFARYASGLRDFTPPAYRSPQPSGGDQREMPIQDSGPLLDSLTDEAYRIGLVVGFDWSAWLSEAEKYFADPQIIRHANLPIIQGLLTVIIRSERFSEGTLSVMAQRGVLEAICRRLDVLSESEDAE